MAPSVASPVSPYRAILSPEPYILMQPEISSTFVNLSVLRGLSPFAVIASCPLHRSPNLPPRHARRNLLPNFHLCRILHQLSCPIKHQSIPSLQNCQRRK